MRILAVNNPFHLKIEYRPPDPTANPHLKLSAIVLAGLDSVKKIEPPSPVKENVYKWSRDKLREYGIKQLPETYQKH